MGPITIYDKSFLECLNPDEAVLFDNFFLVNIVPTFYLETLADLAKATKGNRTSHNIVSSLAYKTPVQHSVPNTNYKDLLVTDLLGYKTDMTGRPILHGGVRKIDPDGKIGVYYENAPEQEMFSRWQKEDFSELENILAKLWRETVSNLTFDSIISIVKNVIPSAQRFSNLADIKSFLDSFVENYNQDENLLLLALELLETPKEYNSLIINRFKKEKPQNFNVFAPYAAYVFKLDLFLYLAMSKSFISKERPSNKIDLSYLYYLPFCDVFVSRDKLHRTITPLFTNEKQMFIWGDDLKDALSETDEYLSNLPKDLLEQGLLRMAIYPPIELNNALTQIYDEKLPRWKERAEKERSKKPFKPVKNPDLIERLQRQEKESKPIKESFKMEQNEPDHILIKRLVPKKKGKYWLLPKDLPTD